MPYSIEADPFGRFAIDFMDEPEFVHGFRMAPKELEHELKNGNWLLLTFAVWNSLDRPAIDNAVRVAKQYGGRFQLGVRPFEVADEFADWLPVEQLPLYNITHESSSEGRFTVSITSGNRTPYWHWLSDAATIAQHEGLLDPLKLTAFIDGCLSATERLR